MLNQIFKTQVPMACLFTLLDSFCIKGDNYYLVNMDSYKKMMFHEYQKDFIESLRDYYHTSKHFYLDRKLTYNSFTNIIRQICKSNDHNFTSKIKYNESKYNIEFFIYFDN